MWQQPDSAFALLQTFAASSGADSLDGFDGHYFQLLASELLYKSYCEQSNRAELLKAVVYFDSIAGSHGADASRVSVWPFQRRDATQASAKTTAFLAARAHYINGVGFYERDSVVEACKEYLKALETMEEYFAEKALTGKKAKFMALTYTHLTGLFSDQYLHEQAIYFAKLSLQHYNNYQALPWHMAWVMEEIGTHYDIMGQLDSASAYYYKGWEMLPDTNNTSYRDIATHLAFLSYKTGKNALACVNQLQVIIGQSETETEALSRYAIVGEIYYHEKQYDSACHYLNKVYLKTSSIYAKKQAAEWLVEICRAQGRVSEMHEYAEFLVPFANQEENQSEVKSQLTELYKDFGQKRQERMHQQAKEQYTKRAVVVVGGILAMMLVVVFLYLRNKRKGEHLKVQIKEEQSSHEIQQEALSGKLKKYEEDLCELKKQIGQHDDWVNKAGALSFSEELVCRLIMERVNEGRFLSNMDYKIYKRYALNKEQLIELRRAVDHHFNKFTMRITKAHPELTRLDLDYCCLYLLGLTDADISALMQRAYNTVNERNSKLRRIFGSETPISITLQAIANDATSI